MIMVKITVKKNEHRGDYEVLNESGKCLGFVWKYADHWVSRIGERSAENHDTYDLAVARARELALEDSK